MYIKPDRPAFKALVMSLVAGIALSLMAHTAQAAVASITLTPHAEGAAVNFVAQRASTSAGPWTTFSTFPGTSGSSSDTITLSPGATVCVRVKSLRIADGLDSTYTLSVPGCVTAVSDPAKPTSVTLTVK